MDRIKIAQTGVEVFAAFIAVASFALFIVCLKDGAWPFAIINALCCLVNIATAKGVWRKVVA